MSNEEITHKELLIFSNLVRLEWEFVDLGAIREGDYDAGQGAMDELSTQLNDLLTPEVFVREDANSKGYKSSYPKNKVKEDKKSKFNLKF